MNNKNNTTNGGIGTFVSQNIPLMATSVLLAVIGVFRYVSSLTSTQSVGTKGQSKSDVDPKKPGSDLLQQHNTQSLPPKQSAGINEQRENHLALKPDSDPLQYVVQLPDDDDLVQFNNIALSVHAYRNGIAACAPINHVQHLKEQSDMQKIEFGNRRLRYDVASCPSDSWTSLVQRYYHPDFWRAGEHAPTQFYFEKAEVLADSKRLREVYFSYIPERGLTYQILEPNGRRYKGCFLQKDVPFLVLSREALTLDNLNQYKSEILDIFVQKGHIQKLLHVLKTEKRVVKGEEIVYENRRDETFFPMLISAYESKHQRRHGLYGNVWPAKSNEKPESFGGCTRFVVATCMFGAHHLMAINDHGGKQPLIKHDIQLYPGEKITGIEESSECNVYEELIFKDLDTLCYLMENMAKKGIEQKVKVYCHVPWLDYILFCAALCVRKKMTPEAFGALVKVVIAKRDSYYKKIGRICDMHNLDVYCFSPLENMIDPNIFNGSLSSIKDKILGEAILKELVPPFESEDEKECEARFVQSCLLRLFGNSYYPQYQNLWKKLTEEKQFVLGEVKSIEDLFDLANPFVIAYAADGQVENEVCAMHGVSEKAIQVAYSKFVKKEGVRRPSVLNVTAMESMVSYARTNTSGLMFYHQGNQDSLMKLVVDVGIVDKAREKIGFFASAQTRESGKESVMKDGLSIR